MPKPVKRVPWKPKNSEMREIFEKIRSETIRTIDGLKLEKERAKTREERRRKELAIRMAAREYIKLRKAMRKVEEVK